MAFNTDYKIVGVAFNLILLTAQQCSAAPVQPPTASTAVSPSTTTSHPSAAENAGGLAIAYLQNLRTGLDVLRSIAKSKVANALHIPSDQQDILEHFTNTTGFNLVLLTMCDVNNVLLQLWEVVPNATDKEIDFLRNTYHALLMTSCEAVNAIYEELFPSSTYQLSCAYPEISSLCLDLNTIVFTETLNKQLSNFHKSMVNSEKWIADNIHRKEVLPDVYDIIVRQ